MLTDTRDMLLRARREGYAVGAFNVENLEMAQAVIEAAQAQRAPVILQTTPGTLGYAPPAAFAGLVAALAGAASVPVALHLDHGDTLARVRACLEAGYTSVMIDGSRLPFSENVRLTRAAAALSGDTPAEGELGTVGGKEDGAGALAAQYTDPVQAEEFMRLTGAFSLAVGIGTAHGVYRGKPCLNLALLCRIAARISAPLVLHGASGVAEDDVRACVRQGVCKVNYATDLRQAYTQGVREALAASPGAFDPKGYGRTARERVRALVCARIGMLGAQGRA